AITDRMLQSPIVMDVGTTITLMATHNGIQVKAEGVAMERGRIGKIIRVRNAKSRKVLRGRVLDANTVEII
ncbi:MAG: flagellar basal body P-ring formation protein FlgA, partial [Selenomonadaceae bacterium]|nr:flagellar basal body P-ring formation protein FlgA [Selenomonadaceae bacterium]